MNERSKVGRMVASSMYVCMSVRPSTSVTKQGQQGYTYSVPTVLMYLTICRLVSSNEQREEFVGMPTVSHLLGRRRYPLALQ